jgi:hypothetical protein
MTVSGIGAAAAVALLQGALVALPRGNALGSLKRLRSPAWAVVLPGAIVVGTIAPLGVHPLALGLILMGTLATPPLAAVAALSVVRGPRAALVAVAAAAALLATSAGGWSSELSTTVLTAFGALAVGSAVARLIPGAWVLAGIACMCAVDVALVAAGVAQPAAVIVTQAAGHVHGPLFDNAHVGGLQLDYPDLLLASALGGFVAGQRGQWQAAALMTLLAAASLLLTPVNTMFPATLPAAVTFIAMRSVWLPRRPEVTPLAPQPAAP